MKQSLQKAAVQSKTWVDYQKWQLADYLSPYGADTSSYNKALTCQYQLVLAVRTNSK